MSQKKKRGRKVRVDFKQNRLDRQRRDDWTQRYRAGDEALADEQRGESVRAKGDLSRRRTVIVDDDALPQIDEKHQFHGVVTRVHGLICYVDDEQGREWACTVRRVLRTVLIERRSTVTVGDRVWLADASGFCDGERVGVIERVDPRKTHLSRRDRRQREHVLVANADQLLAVISVAEPNLKPHLVDRYLVAAHKGGLDPLLCFNKADLLAGDDLADTRDTEDDDYALSVQEAIAEFHELGYPCLLTSATTGAGVADLRASLQDRVTVLSGQSGVGKSSLINALQPQLRLDVQTVSSDTQKGRHTTTHARLLPLDFGGYVVDTPGIRAFDVWNVEPGELEAYFVEIAARVADCRFGDCSHRYEQGCAVIAAVEAGAISLRRYHSYLKLFAEV